MISRSIDLLAPIKIRNQVTKQQFKLEHIEFDELIERLQKSVPIQCESEHVVNRTYYDSFDWRLYRAGYHLSVIPVDDIFILSLGMLTGITPDVSVQLNALPRFVWDLPISSKLRQPLEDTLEMRALLPQTTIETICRPVRVLNTDKKTVVRINIEEYRIPIPESEKVKTLASTLYVYPVKGYPTPLKKVTSLLTGKFKLSPVKDNLLDRSLFALGRQVTDYSSKLNISLDPTMRADSATKIVLRHLLTSIRVNAPGVLADIDSEFLHDYRVAIRRTRSALSQIKNVFTDDVVDTFASEFAWLGRITSPTRDLDVYLLKFDTYKSALPPATRDDLNPLGEFIRSRQKLEHQRMVESLKSSRYQQLIQQWTEFLASPLPEHPIQPNAILPIGTLANKRIWRLYKRVLKEGGVITPTTPAVHLHELRKTCKKLRYLIEFFQSLYSKKKIKANIQTLKELQDNLGDFQDFEVQETTLKEFGEEMLKAGETPAKTLLAMGILVQNLDQRRQDARSEFAVRYTEFASKAHQAQFKELFAA